MPLSITTGVAVAAQTAQGTPATSGFHRMRNSRSMALPRFDYEDALNEHSGVHQRASSRQSVPDRTSVIIPVNLTGILYPDAIGVLLQMAGFEISSVANTGYKVHTIIKSDTDAARYGSLLLAMGESVARFERKISDVRLSSLELRASRQNIQVTADGFGLDEAVSSGSETVTAEPVYRILPTTGVMTWGALALGTPREHTITIARPVEEDDQHLHAFERAALSETGWEVNGVIRGLDFSAATYKKLVWNTATAGAITGAGPGQSCVLDNMAVEFRSAANIAGAAVPYSLKFAFTKCDFRMTNLEAQGNQIIRADVNYYMIDDTASNPLVITLNNNVTNYP